MVILGLISIILVIVAINDFLFFRIENEYVLALLLLYAVGYATGVMDGNLWEGLQVAMVGFIITFMLNRYGLMGGGDVKLLVPLLLLAGHNWSLFIFYVSLVGLVISIIYMLLGRRVFFIRRRLVRYLCFRKKEWKKCSLLNFALLSLNRITKRSVALRHCQGDTFSQEIPYGVALTGGSLAVVYGYFSG